MIGIAIRNRFVLAQPILTAPASDGRLKTAKALGIEVPPTLLGRADEVIE